jgi:hypothetical protein
MFHLFKRIYLDFDHKIDLNQDRIICSNINGGNAVASEIEKVLFGQTHETVKSVDDLIGPNGLYPDLISLLRRLNEISLERDRKIFIYCDWISYYKLLTRWLKIILPHATGETTYRFLKSHIYREQSFVNYRWAERNSPFYKEWNISSSQWSRIWNTQDCSNEDCETFLATVMENMRVEFLLAGYLYDGRHANHLATAMTPLVKKNLEAFIYEHKEIMFVHLLHPRFQQVLKVENGPYDFDNFYDMIYDSSPMVRVLFEPEIWGEDWNILKPASSGRNINWSGFTPQKIQDLKDFSIAAGTVWTGAEWYSIVKSQLNQLDMIEMFIDKDTLNTHDIKRIVDSEINDQDAVAGSFYSLDLSTVNFYFVDFLLQNHKDKDTLKPYIIK